MKKTSIILIAFALAMTMSQCKKKEGQPTSNDEVVTISLDVTQNNGSRVVVNPSTGTVDFETGDKIYVGSGGKYVGFLTHNGTNFVGNITNPIENQPLQFYFLGNVTPTETLSAGTTEECSVIISDQTEHLPVVSTASSNENYATNRTDYTAHLLNKCALVKFNVTTSSEATICVVGFNNKVTVNFMDNTLTNNQETNGVITLPAGNGERWAILLPQEALEAGGQGSAYSQDGVYLGTCGAVPTITENGFLISGIQVVVTTEVNPGEVPVGAINGKFTINANGDQVYFSQGNLQYIGSATTPYWKFADNQWDYYGSTTGQNSSNQNVDRDLFGWGTSGWNNGNLYYQPYDTDRITDWNAADYGYGYGPTDGTSYSYNLTDDYANADWGVHNAISNGGNIPNQWRTLIGDEWLYVFFYRSTPSEILYAKAVVNNTNGVILLPDDWNAAVYTLNYPNRTDAPYTTNEISASDWATLENAGAIFLPAAGDRFGTSVSYAGSEGGYWSSSSPNSGRAYSVYFSSTFFYPAYSVSPDRYYGRSVRLVHDVN